MTYGQVFTDEYSRRGRHRTDRFKREENPRENAQATCRVKAYHRRPAERGWNSDGGLTKLHVFSHNAARVPKKKHTVYDSFVRSLGMYRSFLAEKTGASGGWA